MIQYSQKGCPMCDQLKQKQDAAGAQYSIETDRDKLLSQGITHVPMLRVGEGEDGLLSFAQAMQFVNAGGVSDVCHKV